MNDDIDASFDDTINNILNSCWVPSADITLQPIEEDLLMTFVLRNFGGHKIRSASVINREFEKIFQRILNALFFSIETLYPIDQNTSRDL